jgi:uncharacterized protein
VLNKEKILEVLVDWNYWDKELKEVINRPRYGNLLEKYRKNNKPIFLIGMRRVGKTFCLLNEMKNLNLKNKKQILYVNFEDNRFEGNLNSYLLDQIIETYRVYINNEEEFFLFLDEIQNVEGWEKWVRTNYDLNKIKKMYITGSSAKLLSKEISSAISGRYLELKVFPLSFTEFLMFNEIICEDKINLISDKNKYLEFFIEFLKVGGFPEIVMEKDDFLRKQILESYFDTLIYKDIVARYNLKDSSKIKKILKYLLSNDTKKSNLNSIAKATGMSYNTVEEYVSFFKEIFLISELFEYNYSLKKQYKKDIKFYCTDLSFVNSYSFNFSENKGRLLENIVLNSILMEGNEVYYYSNGSNECDFVILNKNIPNKVIQVCYDLNEGNEERELQGLVSAMNAFNLNEGLILTFDKEDKVEYLNKKIIIKPLWKWLLENKL